MLETGLLNVDSYLNTGNVFFESDKSKIEIETLISDVLKKHYSFDIPFVLVTSKQLIQDYKSLPSWWQNKDTYRKDVLFYLNGMSRQKAMGIIENEWNIQGSNYFLGESALFWGSNSKEQYATSVHSKRIMKPPFNNFVTLRNSNTFDNIIKILKEKNN